MADMGRAAWPPVPAVPSVAVVVGLRLLPHRGGRPVGTLAARNLHALLRVYGAAKRKDKDFDDPLEKGFTLPH